MEEQPVEHKEQPKPPKVLDNVKVIMKAYKLCKNATHYITSPIDGQLVIYQQEGQQTERNPMLAEYIKRAEKAFIMENTESIINQALGMLHDEIEEIRGLVNG